MTPKHSRPTAPHLQIYKLPLTAIISISHRITGVFLVAGVVSALILVIVIAQGESAYNAMQALAGLWLVKSLLAAFTFALFFHLCHGVRHLYWDIGKSFETSDLNRFALIELLAALALTLCAWVYLL